MLSAEALTPGEYTVVCDPELTGVFTHEAFGHLSEADGQIHDPGLLHELRIGRRFGPQELHIYDTGRDEGTRGYLVVDDEGTPAADVDLIRDGILVGRLHSRRTAGVLGEHATGNGRSINYRHPPIVRMRNTVMAPGSTAREDLFRGIKSGIYAKGSSGGQTNGG
ncbi:modulator of DNA gyrase peptidase U62, partial [mine drainage metagenome]